MSLGSHKVPIGADRILTIFYRRIVAIDKLTLRRNAFLYYFGNYKIYKLLEIPSTNWMLREDFPVEETPIQMQMLPFCKDMSHNKQNTDEEKLEVQLSMCDYLPTLRYPIIAIFLCLGAMLKLL